MKVLACMAAIETGSLLFIVDVTADRGIRLNSEAYRGVLSAQIQPKVQCFTVQMDKDPKHTAKATFSN